MLRDSYGINLEDLKVKEAGASTGFSCITLVMNLLQRLL
jgi:hypothetical protein